MMETLRKSFQLWGERQLIFSGFAVFTLLSIFAAIASREYWLVGAPVLLLLTYLTIVDFRQVFFLLLACIPLSTEVFLPNGLGTDLPTEPLIVGLMLVYVLYLLRYGPEVDGRFFRHPVTLLLFLHLGWIGITTIVSSTPLISIKYLLAKFWYLATFYFLAALILRNRSDVLRLFWYIFIPLIFTIIVILFRHAPSGFSFALANKVMSPFYRNHVAYASIMVVFVPFLWYIRQWYPRRSARRRWLNAALVLLIIAIYFTYTRAAFVALFAAPVAFLIIRLRLSRVVFAGLLAVAIALFAFFAYRNTFLDYAPNYERTITHYEFDNLLEATYQGEDISTMERVYRWIAGFYMIRDKPVFGFGPGNFSFSYEPYTLESFRTYVSDNPERSGIHSYYLMITVEQGLPGVAIFLALVFIALLTGEKIYHRTSDRQQKQTILMVSLSLIIILILLIINDLIETDKIGSFFFIELALLVNLDLATKAPLPHEKK